MTVIECIEGSYKVQDVEFGTVYRWCPECVVVECDCGERVVLTGSETACGRCDTDYATVVHEELAARRLADEDAHPWRYDAGDREESGVS